MESGERYCDKETIKNIVHEHKTALENLLFTFSMQRKINIHQLLCKTLLNPKEVSKDILSIYFFHVLLY